MKRWLFSFLLAVALTFSVVANALADDPVSDLSGDLCPDANVISGIMDQICWSCLLPIRLAGIGGDKPAGAASDRPFCACLDEAGLPEIGMPLGFFQPARLLSFSATPYCMPSFGTRLTNDNTRMGIAATEAPVETTQLSFFHYKYWIYPVMAMINMFTNSDCSYDAMASLDLAYFSEADPLYSDDLLSFLLAPESVLFANPVATSICTAECATIMAGGEIEETFFCAGCNGNLYPLTGNVQTNDDPIRTTSLLTSRVLASLHRRGQARLTMGDHMTSGSCEPEYAPMVPKTQYKVSMLYPVAEARGNVDGMIGSNESGGATLPGDASTPAGDGQTQIGAFPSVGNCCHRLGESVLKWALNRNIPGKEHPVYLLYRWNDCCMR
ncbi:TraU family protein [Vibrio owensii]|uniref:TraU family protein n=1 Tax=Vibrio owensii TaxID=696485 RepID=UPI004067FF6C